MSKCIWVLYIIIHRITKTIESITIKDIKSTFPLSGEYIFRCRYKTNHSTVWLDISNDGSQLPLFNNRIFIKATRLSWEDRQQQPTVAIEKPIVE